MKHLTLIAIAAAGLQVQTAQSAIVTHGSSAYEVVYVEDMDNPNAHYYGWWEAQSVAASRSFQGVSGHLVTIGSKQEDDFVMGLTGESGMYWAGGLYMPQSQTWHWGNGEGLFPGNNGEEVYANWIDGQGTPQSFSYLTVGTNWKGTGWAAESWNDMVCGFIIEYSNVTPETMALVPVPEPWTFASGALLLLPLLARHLRRKES